MLTKLAIATIKTTKFRNIPKAYLKEITDIPMKWSSPDSTAYYVEKDNGLKAILVHQPTNKKSIFYGMTPEQLGNDTEIESFWVDKESRGSGLGSKLLSKVIDDNKDKYIGLATGPKTTAAAKHLYRKTGFNVVAKKRYGKAYWWLKKPDAE